MRLKQGFQSCYFSDSTKKGGMDNEIEDSKEFLGNVDASPDTFQSVGPLDNIGIPVYLSIPGFKVCLKEFSSNKVSTNEYCLPSEKPYLCSETTWKDLQNTFYRKCPIENDPTQGKMIKKFIS